MLIFNLLSLIKARGAEKPFTYLTKAGFTPSMAHNLLNNQTVSFRLNIINKLCTLLNCTPNDLLYWKPNPGETLPESHPLNKLKRKETDYNWQEVLKTLPLAEIEQLLSNIKQKGNLP